MMDKDKDLSKSDLDLSGDYSSDTVPTDGTLGLSHLENDDDIFNISSGNNKLTGKSFVEYKQLVHDLQLAKIELSQKDVLLNNLKYEYTSKVENLEEKLNDTLHQNNILSARLNSIINIHQEESQRKQEQVKIELGRILIRQKELEENNQRFMKHENDIKRDFNKNLEISDSEYENLNKKDDDLLTIREYATLKFYEILKPLKEKLDETTKQRNYLEENLSTLRKELIQTKESYEEEKRKHHVDTIESQKIYYELADAKSLIQQANFKKDNYDRIKYERDEYERKYTEAETNYSSLQAQMQVLVKERDELSKDISQFKQEVSLLKQDKDYLHKQYLDVQNKYMLNEAKVEQLQSHLEEMKKAREETYEKYINSKDFYKSEYDTKLNQELEQLRTKTAHELEKLRLNMKDFYERENRALKESRDLAISDKDKAEQSEKEIQRKYNELMNELRTIQLDADNKFNEVKSDLKLKTFELERANLLNEETGNNLRKSLLENEKLNKKIEVLQNEYYALQIQNDKGLMELENELNEKRNRLQNYEKLEHEMDEVILQAAESENNEDAEKMLMSYGYGANIVSSAKRRIQQNVHLTRRILQLEKINTTLRRELERERGTIKQIKDDLDCANNIIDQAKQPQEYLIASLRKKEIQLKQQKNFIETLEKQVNELTTERERLLHNQNEMTTDIERLLRHNEELFVMRNELEKKGTVMNIDKQNKLVSTITKPNTKSKIIMDSLETLNYNQPEPMMFTKYKSQQYQQKPTPKPRKSPEMHKKVYSIDKT